MKIVVNVSLKAGVLDSQGKAVHHALESLHFNNVSNVRVGKQIVFNLDESDEKKAMADVTRMCEDLLANTVIEDYAIELIK
ncbi:MAG: phosphoribosylformylglycinamidine synthase subunit PurS [Sulfurimonas sp.]|jgi:phosphoribosylformylglycinamidine synthase|uniref:phosphoribosylformylglycinamidine synthase subunit PurS n=1 Tax=unclassified Sulfurimonas TaxID=2623549 RepID=UPI0008BC2D94|nr:MULTISPECIES: phosphoribosylformylglycinamidine synthase subunit PurS [unclassified Sulfurimonas]OHE11482.1 MAG: phosphoribosylformylglycinamidine synthase [Sulfurimonas sp. RIFOXYC2_FULL_36_7]OHE15341.1 MAG: phosphoribosylformylglycinamidine synthase [Sulfurimonas sp. RIFOXYD12_FULL_36_11]OHE15559.1 MAG: phosphoribosylformylglycinamidine synthase [Sulfurimonas sp. RIFOXYD2_FULL_37_8]MBS4068289.1 phosphoribosylformylglycinamidine synthase subunit PurS [Sulfurimonas sp.]MDD3856242.1 phosphor